MGTYSAATQEGKSMDRTQSSGEKSPRAYQRVSDDLIHWDSSIKTDSVTDGQVFANFVFDFTNVSKAAITILGVHPSCGCTTAALPSVPWRISAGSNGLIRIKVNLHGKRGTVFKSVTIATDRGSKILMVKILIHPQPRPEMTDEERSSGIAAAKLDRQAVFKGDCASCHAKSLKGKYGRLLFEATCSICHEAKHRATMVPDLHNLKVPTDEAFWRTWIASGKAGTLMPAFAKSQDGPLTDLQIASLAAYLNAVNPSPANASIAN